MQLGGFHFDTANLVVRDLAGVDLVVQVVLALDADCARLELEVDILGDESHLTVGIVLLDKETGGQNAVVDSVAIGENPVKLLKALRIFLANGRIVDDKADGTAAFRRDTICRNASGGKRLCQASMDPACVCSALGLFAFELVEFGKDIDEDADVVFLETLKAGGVVKKDVRIEDVVLPQLRWCFQAEFLDGFRCRDALGFAGAEAAGVSSKRADCIEVGFMGSGFMDAGGMKEKAACNRPGGEERRD